MDQTVTPGRQPQIIASGAFDANTSGAVVYWTMAGLVDAGVLEMMWDEAGLDARLLATGASPATALKRAMKEYADSRTGESVRPIYLQDGEEGEEGYVVVKETYDGKGRPTYTNVLEVKLVAGEPAIPDGADDEAEVAVRQEFRRNLGRLNASDMGTWLVRLLGGVKALRLRESGGFYFVPREYVATWGAYVAAIQQAAPRARLYSFPALRCDEAVAGILDALKAEADELCEDFSVELEAGKLTERKAKGRRKSVKEMHEKLKLYEGILGQSLTGIRADLDDIEARLVAEVLSAEDGL